MSKLNKQKVISDLVYESFLALPNDVDNDDKLFVLIDISIDNKSEHLEDMLNSLEYEYQRKKANSLIAKRIGEN